MKNILQIIITCLIFPCFITAQHLEVGGMGGFSTYLGDLSPSIKRISTGKLHIAGGGFMRYNYNKNFAIKLGLTYAQVSANDTQSKNPSRQNRNLHFKSSIFETSITGEFNVLGFEPRYLSKTFSPYVFAGIGFFAFNPKAQYQGKWVDLQSLRTEGQGLAAFPERKPYKKLAISVPFGGGFKIAVNDKLIVGMELGLRMTNTDYLDDVSTTYVSDDIINENFGEVSAALANPSGISRETGSTRGNPSNNDWYFISAITVSYNLFDSGLSGPRRKNRRALGCPSF